MRIPQAPPSLDELLGKASRPRLAELLGGGRTLVEGRYLHWDELRHRQPPAGWSLEEWWLGISSSRLSGREPMPLLDKTGAPFGLTYAAPVREGLHEIDQSFGVTAPTSDVREIVDAHGRKYLLSNALMEEAIRSSQLEGASTTRASAKEMIREGRTPNSRGERMILNNFHAMERIEELAGEPLTPTSVFELHRILVEGTLDDPSKAGVFRTDQDAVIVELLHTVETAHIPPRAGELPGRLDSLLAFANGDTPEEWLHPVLRAVILHFMVGYDHPFVDGNGRVARALFYWAMLRHGYPLTKFLSISRVLREGPAKYARAYLHTETDSGDLTYFVLFQLGVISRSIEALRTYVEGKARDIREIEREVRAIPALNHRQITLLSHALRHPGFQYTVKSHERSHGVVNATARADLIGLARKGLLIHSKEGRKFVFVSPSDLSERIAGVRGAPA
jgi:Fic family protein